MDNKEILMVILYIIELVTIAIFYNLYKHWKTKHDKAVDAWSIEGDRKDKLIEKLENELKSYKTKILTQLLIFLFCKGGRMKMFYVRFGEIPKDERSSIYYRGMCCGKEEGVSVYDCAYIRGKYHIILPCPITIGSLDTLSGFLFYNKDKPVYFVEGEWVGTGHDGEPLIRNIKIIADIADSFRNTQSSIDEDKLHNELLSLADKFKEEEE